MGLATLFKKLAADNGIELDADELESLSLTDDESAGDVIDRAVTLDVLGETLSGEAAGAVEIFLSQPITMLAGGKALEQDGLMWEPVIRTGQWAMRPGAGGQKRRSPLKVIAGHSKNQRKQIGLQDIVDAFKDDAIEHVTVPTSHDNKVTENTGFIKGLKIIKGKFKDKLSKKDVECDVLMAGYDIRLPEIKKQMQLGTIASRSAGLLYDYVNTETGKSYGVVLEHVALTNKPWITGMKAFGRKLVGKKLADTIGLSLSDEQPDDDDLLAQEDALESLELADTSITWDKEDDPDWLRARINVQLNEARATKIALLKAKNPMSMVDYYDYPPRYRCVKARPGLALIADDWGDDANHWTAPFSIDDGDVDLDTNLENWKASKRVFVPDEARKAFEPGEEPLKDVEPETAPAPTNLSPLQLAQQARRARAGGSTKTDEGAKPANNETTSRGGEHMAGSAEGLQLSDEAQRLIKAAEDEAKAARAETLKLSQQMAKLLGAHSVTTASQYVDQLKRDGFDEDHGFSGVLTVVQELMSADDGEPALQDDKFADDVNEKGELTLSEAIMRIFKAFKRGEDGKLALGEQVVQPTTPTTPAEPATPGAKAEPETKLGADGKPLPGSAEEEDFEALSEDQQLIALAKDNPDLMAALRLAVPAGAGTEGAGS